MPCAQEGRDLSGTYGVGVIGTGLHAKLLHAELGHRGRHTKQIPMKDGLPTWSAADDMSFLFYKDLHKELATVEPHDGIEVVHREVELLDACVPLSTGERRWLFDLDDRVRGDASQELSPVQIAVASEAIVMTGGLREIVQGRELVRRWAAWRRGIQEFAGHNAVQEAQTHLQTISELLQPPYENSAAL